MIGNQSQSVAILFLKRQSMAKESNQATLFYLFLVKESHPLFQKDDNNV